MATHPVYTQSQRDGKVKAQPQRTRSTATYIGLRDSR